MEQIIFRPRLHYFASVQDFLQAFPFCEDDLILSSRSVYNDFFKDIPCKARFLFQRDFGSGEPTDVMVDAIIHAANELPFKRIIAIGGGTVIDIAKVIAVSTGESMDWIYDHKDELKKRCQLVIVPTTCGTGSEVTNLSIINRTRLGVKMGIASEAMFADDAVLVPDLLKNLSLNVFATSSIDALVHAVESALSPLATPYTKLFSYRAIELIIPAYRRFVSGTPLPQLMEDFLIGSNFAGLAFGTAGCAAVHALSYPLGGVYHVPHGESNYALFTGVLKNYMELKSDGEIAVLNAKLASLLGCEVENVYDALEDLLNQVLPKKPLHEYGMTEEDLDTFSDSVMATQGRLMAKNFAPLDRDRVYKIYKELW